MLNHIDDAKRAAALALVRAGPAVRPRARARRARARSFPGRYFRQTLVTTAHHANRRRRRRERRQLDHRAGRRRRCSSAPTSTPSATCRWATAATTAARVADSPPPPASRGSASRPCRRSSPAGGWSTSPAGSVAGDVIAVDDLAGIDPEPGDAVLFHTGWGAHWDDAGATSSGEPGPGLELAEWLAERGVALTGCDTWSYGPVPAEDPDRPFDVPQILNTQPRRLRRREPRPGGARGRRRARVRPDPHPPEAARRHRRVDLPDRPRLTEEHAMSSTTTSSSSAPAPAAARSPTASPRPASGSCCSSAAATCRASPRTGTPRRCSSRSATSTSELLVSTRTARVPPHAALLRRRQHQVLRRDPVPPARARLRRGPPRRRHLAGVADLLRRPRALLRRGRAALPRARRRPARTRPSRRAPGRSRIRRCRTSRGSSSSPTTSSGRPPPVPPAGRDRPRRGRSRGRALRPLRPLRRLPVPDRRQGRRARPLRAPGARAPATSRCAPTRKVERLETDAVRAHGHRVVVDRRGGARSLQRRRRRRLVRRHRTPPRCCCVRPTTRTRTAWQRLRRGRPPLHGAHQLRRDRDLADAEHDEVPEDARHQRLLLGRRRLGASRSGTSRCSARATGTSCAAGAPWFAPGPRARLHRQARDRLLADHRGPAAPGQPRHASTARAASTSPRPYHNLEPHQRLLAKLKGLLGRLGCHDTAIPRVVGPRPADPARRRRAPVRHRALRRRTRRPRRSTSTAGRTTSTTSTSSTRASSRRPAP